MLNIAPKAFEQIKSVMSAEGIENQYLRVGIKNISCHGFQYFMGFEVQENVDEDLDDLGEQGELRYVVDKQHSPFVEGTVLDWNEEQGGFTFDNPKYRNMCGSCGFCK